MKIKLGTNILALRKAKGMTQEQLAHVLGVSPPAVSKWETDNSCPDITLLCPLARALGTNVDTLLEFEETLSEKEIIEQSNQIVETARTQDVHTAETMLQNLLHQYPSNTVLKFYASTVLVTFEMFCPISSAQKKEQWKTQRKELLECVHGDRACPRWQDAVSQLASIAVLEGNLDKGEQLLLELPKRPADPSLIWSQLYLKQGQPAKALECLQKQLFISVHQVQNYLVQMMGKDLQTDTKKSLEIADIYQQVEELFGCGGKMSGGLLFDVYMRDGQKEKALESLLNFIDIFAGKALMPNPLLFSFAESTESAGTKELKKLLLHALKTEDSLAEFRDDKRLKDAIQKLEADLPPC